MSKTAHQERRANPSDIARSKLVFQCGICLVVVAFVCLVPKDKSPENQFRLWCTLAFFGAVVGFCLQMLNPRASYLRLLFTENLRNHPPSVGHAAQRYLVALDRLIGSIVRMLIATTLLIALRVLSARVGGSGPWVPALASYYESFRWLTYISIAIVILSPFILNSVIEEVVLTRRQYKDEFSQYDSSSSHKKPRDAKNETSPVVVRPDGGFTAGEVDWEWSDLVKNCVIFGQPGSGKTVCVLNAMLEGILGSDCGSREPASALILDPKGDFSGKLEKLCRKYRRIDDLLVIDPDNLKKSIRWNPFDSDDDELELATRFAAVLEAQGMKNDQDSFWIDSAKKFMRHSIALIRLTNEKECPPSFQQIYDLVTSKETILDRVSRLDLEDPRCEQCLSFFANEWLQYASETRTSIQGNITNMIDPFLMQPYAELFSGRSTERISDMLAQGVILYVSMPVADKEAMSKMVCTFLKLEYFREVLKAKDKARKSFFLCDEFQVYFTTTQGKSDADFFERSRQSNHANLVAAQNLPALHKVTPKENLVENLLGQCAVKIFLRNTDVKTNEWSSKLFGQMIVNMAGSSSAGAGAGKRLPGMGAVSVSTNAQYDAVVRPERFSALAIPSSSGNINYAEAIIHLASREQKEKLHPNYKWTIHPI